MFEFITLVLRLVIILSIILLFFVGLSIPFDGGSGILFFIGKLEDRRKQKKNRKR